MKVSFIGAGFVGMASVFATATKGLADEIVIVDLNKAKAHAEAIDLNHALPLTGCKVKAGDYCDTSGSNFVVVSAGVAQKDASETRLELAGRNFRIFDGIIADLDKYCPDATVIISSNPCDALTAYFQDHSIRPQHKVIGTGTVLDTMRFKTFLGEHLGVSPSTIEGAYVLGEHGDNSFINWSGLEIKGEPVFVSDDEKEMILSKVQRAAYEIIAGKGNTSSAIGLATAHIIAGHQGEHHEWLPVSIRQEYNGESTCMSMVSHRGRALINMDLELTEEEQRQYVRAFKVLKSIY